MTTATEVPTGQFTTDWENYGDVNPEPHGGRFVRWDDDKGRFKVVEINRSGALSPDFEDEPGHYVVTEVAVEPQDVWVDGDPSAGFTDDMENILEALGDEHHKQAPAGKPFLERIAYYVADFTHYQRGRKHRSTFEEGDFEDVLSKYGVDDWE